MDTGANHCRRIGANLWFINLYFISISTVIPHTPFSRFLHQGAATLQSLLFCLHREHIWSSLNYFLLFMVKSGWCGPSTICSYPSVQGGQPSQTVLPLGGQPWSSETGLISLSPPKGIQFPSNAPMTQQYKKITIQMSTCSPFWFWLYKA